MKKIMFMLAFVSVGLFSNASNGLVKKADVSKVKTEKKSKLLKVSPQYYRLTVTCSNGNTYNVCCYDYYIAAYLDGPAQVAVLCPYNP